MTKSMLITSAIFILTLGTAQAQYSARPTQSDGSRNYDWRDNSTTNDWRNNSWRENRASNDWRSDTWRDERSREDWRYDRSQDYGRSRENDTIDTTADKRYSTTGRTPAEDGAIDDTVDKRYSPTTSPAIDRPIDDTVDKRYTPTGCRPRKRSPATKRRQSQLARQLIADRKLTLRPPTNLRLEQ